MPDSSEKDLMRAAARYILGEQTHTKVGGSPERVRAFQGAVLASRALYEALRDGDTLENISRLLERKTRAARAYREETGMIWPL